VVGWVGICLIAVLVSVLVIPQIIELANQQWNSAIVPHSSQTSLLDFFPSAEVSDFSASSYIFAPIGMIISLRFSIKALETCLFMNEFVNQMPANEMPIEKDIDVSSSWTPEHIIPSSKSCLYCMAISKMEAILSAALYWPFLSNFWAILTNLFISSWF
jgi:hypothetical protein